MKKSLCFLFCAVLLCACCPWAGASVMEEPDWQEYVEYPLAGGQVFFHPGKGRLAWASDLKGDVVIPAEFDGAAVKQLAEFGNNEEMTSITLPEGLETVAAGSFAECKKLQTIRLSSTVRELPYGGFFSGTPASFQVPEENPWFSADSQGVLYNKDKTVLIRCPVGVTEYRVPRGVTELGTDCFFGCRKLQSVSLPESLKTIGLAAFGGCSGLLALHIPKNVTEIGGGMDWLNASFTVDGENLCYTADSQGALYDKAMTTLMRFPSDRDTVSIPESVTAIGDGAFTGSRAKSFPLPADLQTIGRMAFNSCPNLTAITFPQGLKSIGENAFSNCALSRAELPASVERVELGAFSGYALESLTLPDNVAELGESIVLEGLCYVKRGTLTEQKLIEKEISYRYGRPEDYPKGLPMPLKGTPYIDVDTFRAESEAVQEVHKMGWMRGESGLRFGPDHPATRAMVVTTLYRMDGQPEPAGKAGFSDVKAGSYYEKAAAWAEENGILCGSKGRLLPDRPVTNQEAAAIFYRYLLYTGQLDEANDPPESSYQDRDSIAPWAQKAVDALTHWALYDDGGYPWGAEHGGWGEAVSFSPQRQVARIELAWMLTAVSGVGIAVE